MSSHGPLAFYVRSLTVGGAERVTVTVANGLADRGYDVDLLVPHYEGAFVGDVNDRVTVFNLDTPRIPVLGIGGSIPRLVSYFRQRSPSLVFAQMLYASDVCLVAHMLAGSEAKVFPTVHNTLGIDEPPKEQFVQWAAGQLSSRVDQFIAVSEGAAESVVDHLGVASEQVSVLHNPIPVSEIRAKACEAVKHRWLVDEATKVVLGVGRLDGQKDFETFLRAFQLVQNRDPDCRAILVGQGPDREALETLAQTLGIADVVDFMGYVDNPYAYMARADVLAMSSIHEGLPTVLIEALACGCPVVSTDCPSGPRTILQDGTIGPLVPVGDHSELAEAVQSILAAPPDSATLVERACDFEPGTVLDEYEAFVRTHSSFQTSPATNS